MNWGSVADWAQAIALTVCAWWLSKLTMRGYQMHRALKHLAVVVVALNDRFNALTRILDAQSNDGGTDRPAPPCPGIEDVTNLAGETCFTQCPCGTCEMP